MVCDHTAQQGASLRPPTSSDAVFKDDCMFCFDTAFDTDGLDICLHCFQSFSRGTLNHTSKHASIFDHSLFLNYKKVLKPQREEQHPLKMAKLEIKEELESDLFDVSTALYCSECDELCEIPDAMSSVVEAVLKATSSEKKDEIKSWEQEIVPCQHCFDLVQTPVQDLNLTKCTQCDLKENLWICITCGALGCGREQFGGVPGNSHALAHYSSCNEHPIAVKLGSLSATSADCFCYSCNDEVKVPDLPRLLATFGINIEHAVKTEKNLTELQIEQNVKWDFKMDRADGSSLEPVFGKGLTGLKNLGNSCYMSSVLQVLFSTPAYQSAFPTGEKGVPDESLVNPQPAQDLETQLYKISDGLLSGRYSVPDTTTTENIKYQKGIKPSGFKSLIGDGHPEFCTMKQQDAFEFWLYLTDNIDKLFEIDKSPNIPFKFVTENKLKCSKCGGVRISKELSEVVSLPADSKYETLDGEKVYDPITFDEVMQQFGQEEQIEYKCPQCNSKEIAVKSSGFATYPEILVLNPQRIKLENWVPTKTQVPIQYNHPIDLSALKAPGLLAGESLLPEDEAHDERFTPNETAMEQLMAMGFSKNRATRALFNAGNTDSESAMNWLFAHMEDPDIDDAFIAPVSSAPSGAKQEDVDNLVGMGFAATLASKALIMNSGNMEAAVEWLFANPNNDGVLPSEPVKSSDLISKLEEIPSGEAVYELTGIICHKGVSVNSGHYVAFVKKQVDGKSQWVLFNDEKVVLTDEVSSADDMQKRGYIYVFSRK